jgi:ATP-dependent Clp protease ATP-binding subunit ClpC
VLVRSTSTATILVLNLARTEADALGHNWVGCEHLLLAFLHDQGRRFTRECAAAGITLQTTRAELERRAGPREMPIKTVSPYSPRLKRVLQQAERVAARSRSETVEPDHLLEALFAEDQDAAFLIALRNVHRRSQ